MSGVEVASLVIGLVRVVSAFNSLAGIPGGKEHASLLQDYTLSMRILEDCAAITKTVPDGEIPRVMEEATHQCISLAEEVVVRQEKWPARKGTLRQVTGLASFLLRTLLESKNNQQIGTEKQLLEYISRHERSHPEGSARSGRSFDLERETFFTVGQESTGRESVADVVTLAEKAVTQTIAKGIAFDSNPSLTFGSIALTHKAQPRYVPVRAKYDTGSDVNLVPAQLIVSNDLSSLLVEGEDTFIDLNNQEYHTHHTITLKWCAVNMHKMRTTTFHVTDDLPFDMVLGDPFIQENAVFDPQRVALPLRRKHRGPAERKEEGERKKAHAQAAAEELRRTRNEDARKRALEREARNLAMAQTSASSMISGSSGRLGQYTNISVITGNAVNAALSPSTSHSPSSITPTTSSSNTHDPLSASSTNTDPTTHSAASAPGLSMV
ncbi:hypothetical protein CC80DRAFT_505450 [Byssothecium circinans]|uniref:Peptidase A2 domain-containing protein n=1 Tax=Byssothecium circinans TaxID=147558 RepID=A0A6A5TRK7_9PLEO|nr:hypothetical protein CC80DRAFT_505450 [Byssothecium circinans]